ncbi:MAG: endopeptidase La [Alphaproteobacteria bacterium]|nr:endopeptidase La [Alphaproteobacteria bacterium]
MIVPLFVGREKSVKALEEVMNEDKMILLVSQKNSTTDEPEEKDVYRVGTLGSVLQLLKLPDGTVKVLVEGLQRVRINNFYSKNNYFEADAEFIEDISEDTKEQTAIARSLSVHFADYVKLNRKLPSEILSTVNQIEDESKLADTIASHLSLKISEKQVILEEENVKLRLEKVYTHVEKEIDVFQVEKQIRHRVKGQMEKNQREYYLNEQIKAIQKELGDADGVSSEFDEIEEKINTLGMSVEAKKKATAELKKLRNMSSMSSESTVVRNYLDWLTSIPWNTKTEINKDIEKAWKVLEDEHYGLEKVKERIIEYLAVQQRSKKPKGPILCLVGPPGVGKTSLGESIARATGRKFVRASLGGMRDEAEIRGHRRTYIGSMPGKIIQGMKKADAANPFFLLDEIDKLGNDWRGDPSSALLEVLDPEQNTTFNDHYLEVDYDLSDVMFVTTANSLKMPKPLLDRMEIIHLSGYTEDEKVEIVKRHLIPKQREANGIMAKEWKISDAAIRDVIRYYTRESGVRNLEREINKLIRKATKEIVMDKDTKSISVTCRNLKDYLGVRKCHFGQAESKDLIGVTTGLAWTEVGGDLLSIEALAMIGKGKAILTGQLGDVMKESIEAARSFVRSRCLTFGINPFVFEKYDIHVHVPEGATPKDGPSAGVAMCTTIVSALTGVSVRKDVAMTGEITLRGRVLPIGGLKEKLLAALRGGIKTVLIPKENEKDLEEIPDNVKEGLEIIPVSYVSEVLDCALASKLTPIEEGDLVEDVKSETNIRVLDEGTGVVIAH